MDKFVVKKPSASSKPKTRSHLPVNITANDRARNNLEGTFHVDDGRLFSLIFLIYSYGNVYCGDVIE